MNTDYEEMIIKPVGYVKGELKTPSLKAKGEDLELEKGLEQAADEVRKIRSLESDLVINPELDGILEGLEDYSHAVVVYWPHLLPPHGRLLTKVHPMGQKQFPLVGIFSTCSPARPNPVLVTTVRILKREKNILKVQGLEAVDGSPIIDIKPFTRTYFPDDDVKYPDWMNKIQQAISRC
jgi:tRNA-Thr(GGU) m(6)t(6)A37 methyltransferase TsaA